jgi:hypothetical protein
MGRSQHFPIIFDILKSHDLFHVEKIYLWAWLIIYLCHVDKFFYLCVLCTNFVSVSFEQIIYLRLVNKFLQICSDDANDETEEILEMVLGAAMIGQIYVGMFLTKNPPTTSTSSGMEFMLDLFNTPWECHRQLRMSTKNFFNLHRLIIG